MHCSHVLATVPHLPPVRNKFNRKKKEKANALVDTRASKKRIHECNTKRIHALNAHKGRNAIALITWKNYARVRAGPEIPARNRFLDNAWRKGGEQSARARATESSFKHIYTASSELLMRPGVLSGHGHDSSRLLTMSYPARSQLLFFDSALVLDARPW